MRRKREERGQIYFFPAEKGTDLFFRLDEWHQVENKSVPFSFRAIPIYTGTNPIPTGVTLSARGSSGLTLDVSIPNINGAR